MQCNAMQCNAIQRSSRVQRAYLVPLFPLCCKDAEQLLAISGGSTGSVRQWSLSARFPDLLPAPLLCIPEPDCQRSSCGTDNVVTGLQKIFEDKAVNCCTEVTNTAILQQQVQSLEGAGFAQQRRLLSPSTGSPPAGPW